VRKEIRSRDDFLMLMVITRSRMPKYTGYGVLEDVGVGNIWVHHEGASWRVLLVDLREKNLHIDPDNELVMQSLLIIESRTPRYSACGVHDMGSGWYVEAGVRGKDDSER
jgi:hypothetical protein